MEEAQRLDYLINALSGGNAKNFAEKTGIRPDSLSRARNGRNRPSFYFERILKAFPDVNREWLYSGLGEPLLSEKEKNEVLSRLKNLENEVNYLSKLLEKLVETKLSN